MFRSRLHPSPSSVLLGIAMIAFWALLWLWFIVQLADSPRSAARAGASLPELSAAEVPASNAG
ncbi:MAG TPA: hypothetical protein VMK66_14205 [Myxococcales bacterium]|nr:hypothetical protein [Myxococcales bacterium]